MEELGVAEKNECEDQGKVVQDRGKTNTAVLGGDMGIEEGTGK